METRKAIRQLRQLQQKSQFTPDEEFTYTETLNYLIESTHDTSYMVELGGYYYGRKEYDLALKYYEMAYANGNAWVAEGLGYIWYYGRTGERDYEKAFHYYSEAAANGVLRSEIKVADMYKNGYYVEPDYDKYCEIIENAKEKVANAVSLNEPLPEIYTRLARIREKQGQTGQAADLYVDAINFLAERIKYNAFFGDLNVMKWTINDLYKIVEFDDDNIFLFDLYYRLNTPVTITFRYEGRVYEVESQQDEGATAVRFEDKWYRTMDDFFMNAAIDGQLLVSLYDELYDFAVISGEEG